MAGIPMRDNLMVWAAAAAAFSLPALLSCSKGKDRGTVLAEVGPESLTLEELRESFPAEFEHLVKKEQYLDFIQRWIEDEVIHQEALKNRLDENPSVIRKLEKLKRKLLIEEYLASLSRTEVYEPDEVTLNQYYEMHKDGFRRERPAVKYVHIRLEEAHAARKLRWRLTAENFLAQSSEHSLDPTPESYAALTFKSDAEAPPCLAEELFRLRPNQTSMPIECEDGHYIVRVVEKSEAGDAIPFEEAKEEISATLIMSRKDKVLQSRVDKLKESSSITLNVDKVPGMMADEEPAAAVPVSLSGNGEGEPAAANAAKAAPEPAPKPAKKPRPAPPSEPAPASHPAPAADKEPAATQAAPSGSATTHTEAAADESSRTDPIP